MQKLGFTLIELSIVLVIIALIVGSVLVGKDLISAAATRAQITQIERYQTAVNTFRTKYGFLPGDVPQDVASQCGLVTAGGRQQYRGDGNGVLTSNYGNPLVYSLGGWDGELTLFWSDLSNTNLIDFQSKLTNTSFGPTSITFTTTPNIPGFFPEAKIGNGNYVFVWAGGYRQSRLHGGDQKNYFSVLVPTSLPNNNAAGTTPGLTVEQAYNIDTKVDDGMPQTGKVAAFYRSSGGNFCCGGTDFSWAPGNGINGANSNGYPTNAATGYLATNCYDNDPTGSGTGTANTPQTYSLNKNASAVNCALSFQFQ